MSQVILDGQYVPADQINPAKHRFIGTFRPPLPDPPEEWLIHGVCRNCNTGMRTSMGNCYHKHWAQGCFDVPQYVTMKEGGE